MPIKVHHTALLWLFAVILIAGFTISQLKSIAIETDILALLPQQQHTPLIEKALTQRQSHSLSLVFLIAADSNNSRKPTTDAATVAVEKAKIIAEKLNNSGLFDSVSVDISDRNVADIYRHLLPYRFHLLTPEDRTAIRQSPQGFLQKSLNALYSPLGIQRAATLATDPLFTYGNYLQSLDSQAVELRQDIPIITHQGHSYALITAEMDAQKQGMSEHQQLLSLYRDLQRWAEQEKLDFMAAGLPLYNALGAASAKREISTVGVFSVVAIILLTVVCFRSPAPLFLALTSIGTGVLTAFGICLQLFDNLHIITLVFGSSLIGVSIDYAFHYFSDFFNDNDHSSQQRLKTVFPGITLGMTSSVLAYGALAFAPFPGLQQIAAFSATGLIAAWLTVVALMPFVLKGYTVKRSLPLPNFYPLYIQSWPRLASRFRLYIIPLAILFCASGLLMVNPVDDIRQMNQAPTELLLQETRIKDITHQKQESQFFLVQAPSINTLLEREMLLSKALNTLVNSNSISGYTALSNIYPDEKTQQADYQLYRQQFIESGLLEHMLQQLGMAPAGIETLLQDNKTAAQTVSFQHWLSAMPENKQALFLGCEKKYCASIVTLSGISDIAALTTLGNTLDSAIVFVDQVGSFNQILLQYRQLASYFLVVAIVAITLLLTLVLNLRSALIIISTPIIAILFTLACLVHWQSTVSLFNIFALLLVLGISLDYAIFQHLGTEHQNSTALAIVLSLMTTLLAFGLLALSSTQVIHAFGLTLAIGITAAFFTAPLLPTRQMRT